MPRVTLGVDVGKGTHQAAGYDPAADRVVGRVTFPVSRAGFERFPGYAEIRRKVGNSDPLWHLAGRGRPELVVEIAGGRHQLGDGGGMWLGALPDGYGALA